MASSGSTVGSRWSHREVECLLAIWADDTIQAELEKTHKKFYVFGRIHESMTLLWSMQRTLGDDVLRRDDVCTRAYRGQATVATASNGHGQVAQCECRPENNGAS